MSTSTEKCPSCNNTGLVVMTATYARGPHYAIGQKPCGCPAGQALQDAVLKNSPAAPPQKVDEKEAST